MNVLQKINVVLMSGVNTTEVDTFVQDLRDSLAKSNAQFVSLPLIGLATLVIYHLVVYEKATGLSFQSLQIPSTALFRKVFLVVPGAVLVAAASIGYLRRCQREVYDYLCVARSTVLAKTGLHELRLPSDYLLGLFLLQEHGGTIGKVVSRISASLAFFVFAMAPALYIVSESIKNILYFDYQDIVATSFAAVAVLLSLCSLVIIVQAGRIQA